MMVMFLTRFTVIMPFCSNSCRVVETVVLLAPHCLINLLVLVAI